MTRSTRVTGSLAEARPLRDAGLYELVRVGARGLLGEIIRFAGDVATLQIYEDTTGLAVGAPVTPTGAPLAVELGPGLLGSILDGVGRPLTRLAAASGDFIAPGASASTLDPERRWRFEPRARPGDRVSGGDLLGVVEEHAGFEHRVMVPPGASGTLIEIRAGELTVLEPLGLLSDGTALRLAQSWPLRTPRPVAERLPTDRPLVTGQRVLDLLFPLADGGGVAVRAVSGTGRAVCER
jgi:V/A-type H+-transporting ATPase subunit A